MGGNSELSDDGLLALKEGGEEGGKTEGEILQEISSGLMVSRVGCCFPGHSRGTWEEDFGAPAARG